MAIERIRNFAFPVGNNILSQDAYYRALSEANGGFYPFSENGIWHGGIHVDEGVLRRMNIGDNTIRCMANGEVIAYRMNEIYPKVSYEVPPSSSVLTPLGIQEYVAYFSTGFTLVRHHFVMPNVPGVQSEPPSITLYSLYMHQLDWYGYQEKIAKGDNVNYPPYWHLVSGKGNEKTGDCIKGTIIRKNGASTEGIGLLLKNSKIKVGDQIGTTKWYQLTEIVSGGFFDNLGQFHQNVDSITGYVYGPEIAVSKAAKIDSNTTYTINKENNSKLGGIEEKSVLGIAVYAEASDKTILTYLSRKAVFEFDGQENGYAKITEITNVYKPESIKCKVNPSQGKTGWVKISNLTDLSSKPQTFDKVVVLDKPIDIECGDFVGYLGHNSWKKNKFLQNKRSPLSTEYRVASDKLSIQGHFEIFTGEDLPKFIQKTRALADKLPESEKTLILVDKGAQLISEQVSNDSILKGRRISITGLINESAYVQAIEYYSLKLKHYQCVADNVISNNPSSGGLFDIVGISQPTNYKLTAENKSQLINQYRIEYPELSVNNIPDTVEIIGYNSPFEILMNSQQANYQNEVEIRFNLVGSLPRWIKSSDISAFQGEELKLSETIQCWTSFPLDLTNAPQSNTKNTVNYPRTILLSSLKEGYSLAIDDNHNHWAYITAANELYEPIKGWIRISQTGDNTYQSHVSRVSPWSWPGFDMLEEKASVGETIDKTTSNKKATLNIEDYTESMKALRGILTKTAPNVVLSDTATPFTDQQLKAGLSTAWIAEQIGRLAINYESEWYADEGLSKWNEIDNFYQKQTEQKKQSILDELNKAGITGSAQRNQACNILDKNSECQKNEWQIEKQQRIKPSLWWKEVATAMAAQVANKKKPVLSKLPLDAKIWHLHPVGMSIFKRKLTIVIDPGHGYTSENTGTAVRKYTYQEPGKKTVNNADLFELPQAVIDNTKLIKGSSKEDPDKNERNLVFDVSLKLKKILEEKHDFNIILTRTERKIIGSDGPSKRALRVNVANNNNADYFVSIHADGVNGYTASGSHVIYPSGAYGTSVDAVNSSKELAVDILSCYDIVKVVAASPKIDKDNLVVLRGTNKTTRKVLVELGFLTTPKDAIALFSNIDQIAQQLYEGLLININKYY